MGPTTLDNPLPEMNFSNFSIIFFIIGGLIVLCLQLAKKSTEAGVPEIVARD